MERVLFKNNIIKGNGYKQYATSLGIRLPF